MFNELADIVKKLRKECPWDKKQTEKSLVPYIIEESYELVDAIDNNDIEAKKDELGDFLLQFLLQVVIAEEKGYFKMEDVLKNLYEKLIRRHPHVFGTTKVRNVDEVIIKWNDIKNSEKKTEHLMDCVNKSLPALIYAKKVQIVAKRVGFDWETIEGAYSKMHEELDELRSADTDENREEELGDILFIASHLGNFIGVDAETALKRGNDKFIKRFNLMEDMLKMEGKTFKDVTTDEMEEFWKKAKGILKREGIATNNH
jgi:MazG family protein